MEGKKRKVLYSDVDPDGSAFIWVSGSGSRGIKWREKQSLTFIIKSYLSGLNLKKGPKFENIFFSWLLKDGLKAIKYGDFIVLDPDLDPHCSNFVDPDPHTINADPHHWFHTFLNNHKLYEWNVVRYLCKVSRATKFGGKKNRRGCEGGLLNFWENTFPCPK